MLLPYRVAQLIADGTVGLAFRRWAKTNVRPGQTMLTGAGVIGIESVDVVDPGAITDSEALAAGAASADDVRASLRGRDGDPVFRRVVLSRPRCAGDLAELVGMEKDAFKRNVRKLKNLGLTESLDVGYRLSPRGEAFLTSVSEPRSAADSPTTVDG